MYTQVVLPQATGAWGFQPNVQGGVSYANEIPSTATLDGAIYPITWNPLSSNAQDRTIYVVDTAGTLTLPEAQQECFGLAYMQGQQIASLKLSRSQTLNVVPVTINGTNYQIDNSSAKQTENINTAMSMQTVMAQAPAWTASTAVAFGSYCKVNGVYLYCSTSGTTGSSAPTPPTTFGTPVTDGTAAWELLGRHVWLSDGTMQLFTPQEVLSGATQMEAYLHQQNVTLASLMAQVNAATTVAAVQAVVWP